MPTRLKNPNSSTELTETINQVTAPTAGKDSQDLFIQPVYLKDPTVNPIAAIGAANPLPVVLYPTANALNDSVSGTGAGTTTSPTALFHQINQMVVTFDSVVTSGATNITIQGATSSKVLAVIALPTTVVAQGNLVIPFNWINIALSAEKVSLVIGADFTSGTVNVNLYGS